MENMQDSGSRGPGLKNTDLKPNNQARNLGVILDSDLNFNSHIKSITPAAFYHLKNTAGFKGTVSKPDLESRLDYCNYSLGSKRAVRQLQYIQNAAARVES